MTTTTARLTSVFHASGWSFWLVILASSGGLPAAVD
jgi:hypothetical protein